MIKPITQEARKFLTAQSIDYCIKMIEELREQIKTERPPTSEEWHVFVDQLYVVLTSPRDKDKIAETTQRLEGILLNLHKLADQIGESVEAVADALETWT